MSGFENDIVFAKNGDFTAADNQLVSEANGLVTNGQLWIGSTAVNAGGTHINVGTLTSPNNTITIGYSSPNITLDLSGGSVGIDSVAVQTGISPVVPTAGGLLTFNGAVVAAGTNPVRTDGTGANTLALEVQISQALAATDATKIGLSNFDSAAFDVDANGFVQLNGGGIAATAFDVQTNTAPGTDPVVPSATGVVVVNGAVVANHSVVLESRSRAANAYNLEVQYAAAAAATDGTKSGVAHFDSADFTVDAVGFVSLAISPVLEIIGGPGITITGTTASPIINSVIFTDSGATTITVDSGTFCTAAGTYNLPATAVQGELIHIVCDTAGAVILDAPALNFIRIGSLITSSGGTCTSTSIGDSLTLRYRLSSLTWECTSVIGTWIVA